MAYSFSMNLQESIQTFNISTKHKAGTSAYINIKVIAHKCDIFLTVFNFSENLFKYKGIENKTTGNTISDIFGSILDTLQVKKC